MIYLASSSATRRKILLDAGLMVEAINPQLDEEPIKQQCRQDGLTATDTAAILARAKALAAAPRAPSPGWILAADQMLECEGRWLDKPKDMASAAEQLRFLAGRTHYLYSAACLYSPSHQEFHALEAVAELRMRAFSDDFLQHYLSLVGTNACRSVGGYQLESLGIQLFDDIRGDYFTILGLPLLPLLGQLRTLGILPA